MRGRRRRSAASRKAAVISRAAPSQALLEVRRRVSRRRAMATSTRRPKYVRRTRTAPVPDDDDAVVRDGLGLATREGLGADPGHEGRERHAVEGGGPAPFAVPGAAHGDSAMADTAATTTPSSNPAAAPSPIDRPMSGRASARNPPATIRIWRAAPKTPRTSSPPSSAPARLRRRYRRGRCGGLGCDARTLPATC